MLNKQLTKSQPSKIFSISPDIVHTISKSSCFHKGCLLKSTLFFPYQNKLQTFYLRARNIYQSCLALQSLTQCINKQLLVSKDNIETLILECAVKDAFFLFTLIVAYGHHITAMKVLLPKTL